MYRGITPTPDTGFVKKLKKFDPKLKLEFSRLLGKFVITQPRKLHSGRALAAVVEGNTGGGFRQPDNRDIDTLCRADFERTSARKRIIAGEDYMLNHKKAQEKELKDSIRDATKDDKFQLINAYRKVFNEGKQVRHVRHIIPTNKKGYVVKDMRKSTDTGSKTNRSSA